MQYTRVFTDKNILVTWEKRDIKILGPQGNITFEQKDVECPVSWSDNAVRIVASKYFKKINGVMETSVKQLVERVVNTICSWGRERKYFSAEDEEIFKDELTFILINQYASFNTPVWMNFGIPNRPQVGSACFLLDVEDNMDSIRRWNALESMIFQAGAGAGVNLSNLREENAALSSGGTSSGPISFMKGADAQAGVIKSGGVTRRAAKLVLLDYNHKDIEKFIDCKIEEEKKARVLVEAGYSDGIEGEAYKTVSHQNANYSVRVDDYFMQKVVDGDKDANNLLDRISSAAWHCGDPGLMYKDNILRTYMTPASGEPRTGNPCQPANATLLTPEGISNMGNETIGSVIWSGTQWTTIINKVRTGIKPVYSFETRAGIFIGTEEHFIFENDNRVKVQDAESIDICLGPTIESKVLDKQDIMDGLVIGDGSVHKASNNLVYLLLGQDDSDTLEDLSEYITSYRPGITKAAYEVITTITVGELPLTYDRIIPDRFKFGDNTKVCGFLRGLYTANGSICGDKITLKASSFKVIKDVQEMLSSLGIASYYTTNKLDFSNGAYICGQSYDLNITRHRIEFLSLIGFIQKYKTEKLIQLIDRINSSGKYKKSFEIVSKTYLGNFPVYDITVDCPKHSYWTGGLLVSNCLEIVNQPPFTACNLGSINILRFWDKYTKLFNWNEYLHVINLMTIALDIICLCSDYPDEEIANNTRRQHHIGLGYTNIGAFLMMKGLAYDSDEGRTAIAELSAILTGQSLLTSSLMAKDLGPFDDYEINKETMLRVIENYAQEANSLDNPLISEIWNAVVAFGKKYGFRTANNSAIAPTGTISFMMGADTTGIEPEIALRKTKALVGGGFMTIINTLVEDSLTNLGYSSTDTKSICDYVVENNTVVGSEIKKEHEAIFATSFGDNSLKPYAHINAVAAAQRFITEGISKTCNVPESATVAEIKQLYIDAWRLKLKAISIYRDNSKMAQPLNVSKLAKPKETAALRSMRKPLAQERNSITHKVDISGFECYLTVGLYEDGSPGELFISASKVGSTVSGLLDSFAMAISFGLQYGAPLEALVDKFTSTRFEPAGFTTNPNIKLTTSIVDYIFRWMREKFIDKSPSKIEMIKTGPEQRTGETCKCGSMLVRTGTCLACRECGDSVGGCV